MTRVRVRVLHEEAGFELMVSLHNDLRALGDAAEYGNQSRFVMMPYLHIVAMEIIALFDEYELSFVFGKDRFHRYGHDVLMMSHHDTDLGEHAGLEVVIGIRNDASQLDRTSRLVQRGADVDDLSGEYPAGEGGNGEL